MIESHLILISAAPRAFSLSSLLGLNIRPKSANYVKYSTSVSRRISLSLPILSLLFFLYFMFIFFVCIFFFFCFLFLSFFSIWTFWTFLDFSGGENPILFLVLRCGSGCQIKAQAAARVWAIGHFGCGRKQRWRGLNPL